jgi:hypothetical protein
LATKKCPGRNWTDRSSSQIWIRYQIFRNIYGSGTLDYRYPPDNIGQEGERLDLRPHEVDKDLLVEGRTLAQVLRRLEADRVHDQRYEFRHLRVYEVLPMKKMFIRKNGVCKYIKVITDFICRTSDSTVSEDAGIKPRTVATSALAVRRSNHSARSHPLRLDLIYYD